MTKVWKIGAQLSTTHSAPEALSVEGMAEAVQRAGKIIDLEILIVGTREMPDVFRALTGSRRAASQVYLWYDLLSDEGMDEDDLVVNWRGDRSRGWGGWAKTENHVGETFRFACPNNPLVRRKTLARVRELLSRYAFDGVFLDKMRWPSPANGIDEMVSCFCEHCRAEAVRAGLDLDAVVGLFGPKGALALTPLRSAPSKVGQNWLMAVAEAHPLLGRYVRFRMDSVMRVVTDAKAVAKSLGRQVAVDIFSPGLAPLVGQDYAALAELAAWAKPMTYRFANGPAGLRLEVPALAEGISAMFGIEEAAISRWASAHVSGFDGHTLRSARAGAVPIELIRAEIATAVSTMAQIPVYFGLELVRQPGVIEVTPDAVRETVAAGRAANAAGTIISWDLMHVPAENLRALVGD